MEKQKKSTFTYGVRYFLNQIEIEENEIYFFNLMIQQSANKKKTFLIFLSLMLTQNDN